MEKISILIVDDQRSARQGLEALLSQLPEFQVSGFAQDGAEAVKIVETNHPDIVLMDLQMPGMSGIEAIQQIKRNWPEVKIIALTMYPYYRTEAIEVGADAFLLKGGPPNELQDIIYTITSVFPH